MFNENQFVATCGRAVSQGQGCQPVGPVYAQVGTVNDSESDKVAEGVFSLCSLDGRRISRAFRGLPLRHGLRAVQKDGGSAERYGGPCRGVAAARTHFQLPCRGVCSCVP